MKEIEKIAKEQGICNTILFTLLLATMIVKDVVQGMLDDDMIIQEKIVDEISNLNGIDVYLDVKRV